MFHSVSARYLATEFLYFRSAPTFKHFIRIGDGHSLFNQAMLNQNAMIRRYCQRRWMSLRSAFVLGVSLQYSDTLRCVEALLCDIVAQPEASISSRRKALTSHGTAPPPKIIGLWAAPAELIR